MRFGCFTSLEKLIFNETKGYSIYQQSRNSNQAIINTEEKYLSFASLCAIVTHWEETNKVMLNYQNLSISFQQIEKLMLIDTNTINELELVLNKKDFTTKNTLFSLFKCRTLGGCRVFVFFEF